MNCITLHVTSLVSRSRPLAAAVSLTLTARPLAAAVQLTLTARLPAAAVPLTLTACRSVAGAVEPVTTRTVPLHACAVVERAHTVGVILASIADTSYDRGSRKYRRHVLRQRITKYCRYVLRQIVKLHGEEPRLAHICTTISPAPKRLLPPTLARETRTPKLLMQRSLVREPPQSRITIIMAEVACATGPALVLFD